MTHKDYDKAFMELRAFNMERMGSGEWLQWYIDTCYANGRYSVVVPPGEYLMNQTLRIPRPDLVELTVFGTLIIQ